MANLKPPSWKQTTLRTRTNESSGRPKSLRPEDRAGERGNGCRFVKSVAVQYLTKVKDGIVANAASATAKALGVLLVTSSKLSSVCNRV